MKTVGWIGENYIYQAPQLGSCPHLSPLLILFLLLHYLLLLRCDLCVELYVQCFVYGHSQRLHIAPSRVLIFIAPCGWRRRWFSHVSLPGQRRRISRVAFYARRSFLLVADRMGRMCDHSLGRGSIDQSATTH